VIFRDDDGSFREGWESVALLEARDIADVIPLFREVETASAAGLHAAGFVTYEAASAFDPSCVTRPPAAGLPVAWFLLFRSVRPWKPGKGDTLPLPWRPATGGEGYRRAVAQVRGAIARGEIYQANLTIPLTAPFTGDPLTLFSTLVRRQPTPYGTFIDTGTHGVLSLSPELFFRRQGERVITRPMKGTRGRGRFPEEDSRMAADLATDPKERAENLMIVDLLRNDLAKIARQGSVRVDSLFDVERLPTLFQMTSTISAEVDRRTPLVEIFRALFPCGSVTGAPKRRAMEIITRLEGAPRGVYCGAVGVVRPGGECRFSVPIRTLLLDRRRGEALLGVGSGITWGSDPEREWSEVTAKGAFASSGVVGLIESLRREGGEYPLGEYHPQRLRWSAERLGIPLDEERVRAILAHHPSTAPVEKIRLHLRGDGSVAVTAEPVHGGGEPLRVTIHHRPVESGDETLYLKSDDRRRFEEILRAHPGVDDVLLLNERGELTQGCWNSLVVRIGGAEYTPPLTAGLLPGVMRRVLLERGEIRERTLLPEDLCRCEGVWLINAVRGKRPAILMP